MPTFVSTKIVHTTPALKVGVENATVQDSSGIVIQPITYNEVKNSLGQQNFLVDGFYLYSENTSQLSSVIKYTSRNSTGNEDIKNVVTQLDPFQIVPSLLVDLKNFGSNLILDGNSNIGTTVLGNTTLQLKFLSKRIGNSFGGNYNNFQLIQQETRSKFFEDTYGAPLESIKERNIEIEENLYKGIPESEPHHIQTLLTSGEEGRPLQMENGDVIYVKDGIEQWFTEQEKNIAYDIVKDTENLEVISKPKTKKEPKTIFEPKTSHLPLILLGVAAFSYIMYKNNKK